MEKILHENYGYHILQTVGKYNLKEVLFFFQLYKLLILLEKDPTVDGLWAKCLMCYSVDYWVHV